MARIIIRIPPDGGPPIVKVEGHAGPGCSDLTKGIERALGSVTTDVPTPEMDEAEFNFATKRTQERETQ